MPRRAKRLYPSQSGSHERRNVIGKPKKLSRSQFSSSITFFRSWSRRWEPLRFPRCQRDEDSTSCMLKTSKWVGDPLCADSNYPSYDNLSINQIGTFDNWCTVLKARMIRFVPELTSVDFFCITFLERRCLRLTCYNRNRETPAMRIKHPTIQTRSHYRIEVYDFLKCKLKSVRVPWVGSVGLSNLVLDSCSENLSQQDGNLWHGLWLNYTFFHIRMGDATQLTQPYTT